MSLLGDWLSRWGEAWLERFKARHGLTESQRQPSCSHGRGPGEFLLLHVGCGHATKQHTGKGFQGQEWREIRLDADPAVSPDIVGTMTDMSMVPDGAVDAVFSSHGIEHLYWHDVPRALNEFRRVLSEDGFCVITCPDLQAAARLIAEDRVFETAYESAAGPITPFDIVFSYRPFVAANPRWMAHHCGFTLTTLMAVLEEAGFAATRGFRRENGFDLWVVASKSPRSASEMAELVNRYLPTVA